MYLQNRQEYFRLLVHFSFQREDFVTYKRQARSRKRNSLARCHRGCLHSQQYRGHHFRRQHRQTDKPEIFHRQPTCRQHSRHQFMLRAGHHPLRRPDAYGVRSVPACSNGDHPLSLLPHGAHRMCGTINSG